MKASFNWLRSLVPQIPNSPKEIADRLTGAGLEVESVSDFGQGLDRIKVASVCGTAPHPNRSNLSLVTVNAGGGQTKTVVCGAPNVPPPGGIVCLAEANTSLPAIGLTVVAREIAGVRSEGMLCSEAELGIGDDASGLLILSECSAVPGTPLSIAAPAVSDTVFEIGVTPNRPDALGHIGLARDLAAIYDIPFATPHAEAPIRISTESIDRMISVHVDDFDRCPHYGAVIVENVCIAPSPSWLRYRLHSLGIRPISNIVDITNLLMLEYGHPLHAFDLDLLRGKRIVVRRALDGETMKTLDGIDRKLLSDDLLICDGEGPVALGGVMGGENTEIRPSTRRVLFECAYFHPRGIRRTSRRHGLHTESSHRFERGVDPSDVADVLATAGSLATQLAGAAAVRGAIHARRDPISAPKLRMRHKRLNALLGTDVPFSSARQILDRLGFQPEELLEDNDHVLQVTVPPHRPDVTREADLIEEVARVRSLDEIPTLLPPIRPQPPRTHMTIEREVRQAATELGLSETVTYSFVSPAALDRVGAPAASVRLVNPITDDRSVMRTSLVPGLLEIASRARRHGERSVRLFTLGAVFLPGSAGSQLPDERTSFAALLTGTRDGYLERPQEVDVYDAKGIGGEILTRVTGCADIRVEPYSSGQAPRLMHPRGSARWVASDGMEIGRFGIVHPDVTGASDIAEVAVVIELDVETLRRMGKRIPTYRPIPRLPAAMRDIALVVRDEVPAEDVRRLIQDVAGELCESVELFDVFRGHGIQPGNRSVAFHVVYRDPKAAIDPDSARTLTDQEVDRTHSEVVKNALERLGACLR